MTDYSNSDWDELDANNTGVSPNGVQGGYAPSSIAPILRAMRGAAKRDYVRSNAIYTTTGAGNSYVLTFLAAPSGYTKGEYIRFFADKSNTGAATLNINGLGAKAIVMSDGSALTADQIKANRAIEVYYNGTAFVLVGFIDQGIKFADISANTLSLTAALSIASGGTGANTAPAALAALGGNNANNIILGTLADARLPTTMAGKTFSSALAFSSQTAIISTANTGGTIVYGGTDGNGAHIELYGGSHATAPSHAYYDAAQHNFRGQAGTGTPTFTIGGNAAWHAGNDGAGSGLSADDVDGYHASSLYRADANFTTSGNLTIQSGAPTVNLFDTTGSAYDARFIVDSNNFYIQKAPDAATWSTMMQFEMDTSNYYFTGNMIVSGNITSNNGRWIGDDAGKAVVVAPSSSSNYAGAIYLRPDGENDTTGELVVTPSALTFAGSHVVRQDGGTWGINISGSAASATSATSASSATNATRANVLRQSGSGSDMTFNWSGQSGQPSWLWGGNDGTNMYVWNPSNFSVNYANSAGNAGTLDGIDSSGFARVYTGSSLTETTYVVGHTVLMYSTGAIIGLNQLATPALSTSGNQFVRRSGEASAGTAFGGTWRARGAHSDSGFYLMERTA